MTKWSQTRFGYWALIAVAHAIGVLVLAGLGALLYFDGPMLELFWTAWREGALAADLAEGLALHLLVAGAVWALGCMLVIRWSQSGGAKAGVARVVLERGSVMVETLIVMPVALLLIFGIAQFAVINMAGVLTNLATFEASRAAWLWDGERERFNMSDQKLAKMAQVQAAAVLTPVVPSTFVGATQNLPTNAEAARGMRGVLVGTQLPHVTWNMDAQGRAWADRVMSVPPSPTASFAGAFDSRKFIDRSARKFSYAYLSVSTKILRDGDSVGIELTYHHQCVFPLVASLFGKRRHVGEIGGYFTTFRRVFRRKRQIRASAEWPNSDEWVHGQPVHTSDFF